MLEKGGSGSDVSGTKSELIAIDLLRLASAAGVVAYHLGAFWLAPPLYALWFLGPLRTGSSTPAFAWCGWIGVEIFFVISGFVIAWSASSSRAVDFARRRALRLVPGAWICATLTLATYVLGGVPLAGPLRTWLNAVLFLPYGIYVDPSYWTLWVEISFYSGVFVLLLFDQHLRLEAAARALGAASFLFWCLFLILKLSAADVVNSRTLQLLLLTHGCFFALGVQLWAIQNGGLTARRFGWAALAYATCAVEIAAHSRERGIALHLGYGPILPEAIFAAATLIVVTSRQVQPHLESFINPRLARKVGMMTYPLYLIHQIVGASMLSILLTFVSIPVGLAMLVVLLFVLSMRINDYEAKFQCLLRQGLGRLSSCARNWYRGTRPVINGSAHDAVAASMWPWEVDGALVLPVPAPEGIVAENQAPRMSAMGRKRT